MQITAVIKFNEQLSLKQYRNLFLGLKKLVCKNFVTESWSQKQNKVLLSSSLLSYPKYWKLWQQNSFVLAPTLLQHHRCFQTQNKNIEWTVSLTWNQNIIKYYQKVISHCVQSTEVVYFRFVENRFFKKMVVCPVQWLMLIFIQHYFH